MLCPTFFQTNIVSSGRFADAQTRTMADRFMQKARPVEEVVQAALTAVEQRQFYALPMADARWLWRLKRLVPQSFMRLVVQGLKRQGME